MTPEERRLLLELAEQVEWLLVEAKQREESGAVHDLATDAKKSRLD